MMIRLHATTAVAPARPCAKRQKNVLSRSPPEVKKPSSNMVLHRCRRPNTFWLDTVSGRS
ncbi:Secreted protein [Burkholderia sp. IT-111MI5]